MRTFLLVAALDAEAIAGAAGASVALSPRVVAARVSLAGGAGIGLERERAR